MPVFALKMISSELCLYHASLKWCWGGYYILGWNGCRNPMGRAEKRRNTMSKLCVCFKRICIKYVKYQHSPWALSSVVYSYTIRNRSRVSWSRWTRTRGRRGGSTLGSHYSSMSVEKSTKRYAQYVIIQKEVLWEHLAQLYPPSFGKRLPISLTIMV